MDNYEKFYQLHQNTIPLIIANAWNVKSAQIIEQTGYDAIATSSGAIADSLGYKDGQQIPFNELLYVIKRIKACTTIPLTVDFERGYTDDLDQLNEYIQQLVDADVSGINLEDAQGEDIYLKKLGSVKNYLLKSDLKLFINARTDGFLQKLDAPLETTLRRAKLYQDAGADGLFVTALQDADMIKQITSATTLPVNVVSTPKLSTVKMLAECGIRRISMAVFLYRKVYGVEETILQQIKAEQMFSPLF